VLQLLRWSRTASQATWRRGFGPAAFFCARAPLRAVAGQPIATERAPAASL